MELHILEQLVLVVMVAVVMEGQVLLVVLVEQ